jgi:hypothetical protein
MPIGGTPQAVMFSEESVVSGGSEPFVYHWKKNGSLLMKIPSTSKSIFSITASPIEQQKVVVLFFFLFPWFFFN